MKVSFTAEAEIDLQDIADVIATDGPRRSKSFVRELVASARQIGETPLGYPLVLGKEADGVRRRVFRAYLIFYRVEDGRIDVLRILHGARDYNRILRERRP